MPRIKSATPAEAAKYPREFSILVNLAKDGEAPREVLLKAAAVYGNEGAAEKLAGESHRVRLTCWLDQPPGINLRSLPQSFAAVLPG
ncbi:hypothetical protein MNEG_11547 [Monoraphidium neglectum]|uniref:Uncharacterized protein n=1 Tax=Monoraphidium neglectum TaxID=145388 RepID=A0A0D2J9H7_9CHLO|nr:hypothetical protein MNEG_11547 [Monoraphidium neglectum]KIY96412.1 hypothetical protein MNEG_11547 [Monoraphidium neglectum]|eukprot:XP_013895432.1 hypothetical protein MNEG_11547 [Monoraphidium neglectum]